MARDKLIEMFLDYVNNFITLEAYAAQNGLTKVQALAVISMGKELHESGLKEGT